MARQHERGFFLLWGAGCLLCGKRETPEHVFLDCNTAIYLLLGRNTNVFSVLAECQLSEPKVSMCGSGPPRRPGLHYATGLHSLWRAMVEAVECALHQQTAWQHFVRKVEWVISALGTPGPDPELRRMLARGSHALERYNTNEERLRQGNF